MFRNYSVEFSRYFWICRPLIYESELGTFNQAPAFWYCANKMMTYLLEIAWHPECRGIGPRSLKVATTPSIMTDVPKGQANLSQLSIRGNYRGVASRDMDKVYPRNIAQRGISASEFPRCASRGNKSADSLAGDHPVFSEERSHVGKRL